MKLRLGVAAFFFSLAASCAVADPVSDGIAARTELISINTLTLSDAQFLTGDANAKAVTTTGQLRIANGSGRLPVVVLQHGSGGMGANIEMWAREFNAMGVSTFALDGFTGRGLTQVSTDQALLGRLNFILDAYRGLDVLAKHPRVDPQRIVMMGFSRGGQAALYASLKRFHQMWNKSGVEFAAYVPFYPDCATTFISDTDVADRPIRIFGGTVDDYNPIALCKPYVARLKEAGRDVQLTEYPNAPHSFDNPLGAEPAAVSPASQSVRNCRVREEPAGALINIATKEPFTYRDACVERGPHIGRDLEATRQAKATVSAFVRGVFKLKSE
ncbi:dienelactone hydrolase family protein [Rhodoplanes sp. Z2-YC6860]|uniref:dienelactone hydrolase family protein n=1 Tax=Rhodoplanes sp. Z2-YC6860 TaxID=674703 RepID=UPI00078C885B|nr:dienelactone hydrolase family protein [Rhodoplanes sp. Z2-YC6860]AMN41266.1 dienelactone hydrolase [Rhodoplanes sp. Z2-YC6860]